MKRSIKSRAELLEEYCAGLEKDWGLKLTWVERMEFKEKISDTLCFSVYCSSYAWQELMHAISTAVKRHLKKCTEWLEVKS